MKTKTGSLKSKTLIKKINTNEEKKERKNSQNQEGRGGYHI